MSELVQSLRDGWVCPECGMARGADGYDPCLGELPSVVSACCGHGGHPHNCENGYIVFTNGTIVRFEKLTMVEKLCPKTVTK
jgi:hypothetical protein